MSPVGFFFFSDFLANMYGFLQICLVFKKLIFLLAKVFPSCAGTSDYKSLNSRETRQFQRISTTSQKSNDSMFQKVVFMIGTGGNFTELSEVVPHLLTPPESPSLLRKVANDF